MDCHQPSKLWCHRSRETARKSASISVTVGIVKTEYCDLAEIVRGTLYQKNGICQSVVLMPISNELLIGISAFSDILGHKGWHPLQYNRQWHYRHSGYLCWALPPTWHVFRVTSIHSIPWGGYVACVQVWQLWGVREAPHVVMTLIIVLITRALQAFIYWWPV